MNEFLGGFAGEIRRGFQRFVKVVDVRLVMFAVVNFHGARVDVGFECVEGERECGKLVHKDLELSERSFFDVSARDLAAEF